MYKMEGKRALIHNMESSELHSLYVLYKHYISRNKRLVIKLVIEIHFKNWTVLDECELQGRVCICHLILQVIGRYIS